MRTGSKISALLKRQAARRRAMRHRQFRELAVLSLSLPAWLADNYPDKHIVSFQYAGQQISVT